MNKTAGSMALTPLGRLRRRTDFLRLRKGARFRGRSLRIQAAPATVFADREARFGITVTKKTGSAVERNRIKRRLREAIRLSAPSASMPGHDYVLIADRRLLRDDFEAIVAELSRGLDHIRTKRAIPPGQAARTGGARQQRARKAKIDGIRSAQEPGQQSDG